MSACNLRTCSNTRRIYSDMYGEGIQERLDLVRKNSRRSEDITVKVITNRRKIIENLFISMLNVYFLFTFNFSYIDLNTGT